jgi:hypothetical protein
VFEILHVRGVQQAGGNQIQTLDHLVAFTALQFAGEIALWVDLTGRTWLEVAELEDLDRKHIFDRMREADRARSAIRERRSGIVRAGKIPQ